MKFALPLLFLSAFMFLPARAQAQLASQQTPEYSGPSAKMDRNFDDYRTTRTKNRIEYNRAMDIQRAVENDRGANTQIENRNVVIQRELTRRSYEAKRQTFNE